MAVFWQTACSYRLFDTQPVVTVCSTHSLHRHVRWYCSHSGCTYQTAPCRISCVPCHALLCSSDIINSSCCQMTVRCVRYPISICSLHDIQMLPSDMSCYLWTIMSSWPQLWTVRTDCWKAALWRHRETNRCRDQIDPGVTHSQTNRTYPKIRCTWIVASQEWDATLSAANRQHNLQKLSAVDTNESRRQMKIVTVKYFRYLLRRLLGRTICNMD